MPEVTHAANDFFQTVSGLPPILHDETLFSWCARYHVLSSSHSSRQTSRRLFLDSTAGLRHDFPVLLDRLIARVPGVFDCAEKAIALHTVFPSYAPFLPPGRAAAVIEAMRTGSSRYILSMMGLPTSRTGTTTVLRSCETCLRNDLSEKHLAYWHVEHQGPASFVCPHHQCLLRQANKALMARGGKEFFLPHQIGDASWQVMPSISEDALHILSTLSNWEAIFHDQWSLVQKLLTRDIIRDVCLARLIDNEIVMDDGRLDLNSVSRKLNERFAPITAMEEFSFIGKSARTSGNWVTAIIRDNVVSQHPLKHLVLLAFLFDSTTDFLQSCRRIAALDKESRSRLITARRDENDARIKLFAGRESLVVSRAAKELSLSATTVLNCAVRLGIKVERRQRIVGTATELALVSALESGSAYGDIARALNIRSGFIKDYLATRPLLKERWRATNATLMKNEHRLKFRAALDNNPTAPLRTIRRLPGNGFQWLLSNDREWLLENLPSLWRR